MDNSQEAKTIFRKKPSQFADSYVNMLWEASKRVLDLGGSSDIRKSTNLSSMSDAQVLNMLLDSITKTLQKSMENLTCPDDFILSIPPLLKLMQHLITVLKGQLNCTCIDTLLSLLTFSGSQITENLGAKISTLVTIIDTIVLSLYYLGETKEILSYIYMKFITFVKLLCEFPFSNLLRFSLGDHDSSLKEADYEKCHFFEYVLSVVLSICKYHKISTDVSALAGLFEAVSSFVLKCYDFSSGNASESYFVINNFTLAISILYYGRNNEEVADMGIEISENFKNLFIETTKMIVKIHLFDCSYGVSFTDEMNPLAKIFNIVFQLFFLDKKREDKQICGTVVVLFQVILQETESVETKCNNQFGKEKLRLYTIEFLMKFFFGVNDENMKIDKSLGIENLVLNSNLISTQEPILRKKWEHLFTKMFKKVSEKRINLAIVNLFENSCHLPAFLNFINEWFAELNQYNMPTLEVFIKAGIVEILIKVLDFESTKHPDEVFITLSFCLNFSFVPNSVEIVTIILGKLIQREKMRDYCVFLVGKLLQFQDDNIFDKFIGFFSTETDYKIFECLISALMRSFQDKNALKLLQEKLPSKGLFKAFEKQLTECCRTNPANTANIWMKSFECLDAFLNDDDSVHTLCTLNFFKLLQAFRAKEMKPYQAKIIKSSVNYLEHVVINKKFTLIKTPGGIPLLLEFFSFPELARTEKIRIKFENMLKITTNFNYSVKFGLTSILLHNYDKENSSLLWQNREKMISSAIECKFTYSELAELLKKVKTLQNINDKLALLGILFDSLMRNDLNPGIRSYFSFGYGDFLTLDCKNDKSSIDINNEFSFSVWFFPECYNNCIFFSLISPQHPIFVRISDGIICVDINKMTFRSENRVLLNGWNLLVLNFRSIKLVKVLTSKKFTISLNGVKTKIRGQSLVLLQRYTIEMLVFSSQYENLRSFIGKIAWFNIFSRWLKDYYVKFLIGLTEAYSIIKIPFTIKQGDMKILQELREALIINCTCDSVYNLPNVTPLVSCDIFGGTSVFYVIQAYNPTRFIAELFEICMENEQTLTKAYEIVVRIILSIEKIPTINIQFFQILSHIIRNSIFNDRINELIVMILTNLPLAYQPLIFESYLSKLNTLTFHNKHLSTITKLFKDRFPFSSENLYKYTQLIINTDKDHLKKYLKNYISEDFDYKTTDIIANVLIPLMNKRDEDIIEGILSILENYPKSFDISSPIFAVLLNMLEIPFRSNIHISVFNCLCFKERNDTNLQITISYLIDEAFKVELNQMTAEFLLSNGLENRKCNRYIRSHFVTIILKKLPFIDTPGLFDMINIILEDYQHNFLEYLKQNKICEIWPQDFKSGPYPEAFKIFAFGIVEMAKKHNISISNASLPYECESPLDPNDSDFQDCDEEEIGAKTPHAKICVGNEDFRLISTYYKERAASLDKFTGRYKAKHMTQIPSLETMYFYKTTSYADCSQTMILTSKKLLETIENSWFKGFCDVQSREKYKLQLNYNKYLNGLYFTDFLLKNKPSHTKIRQVYDKYYRWPLLKFDLPNKRRIGKGPEIFSKDQDSQSSVFSPSTSCNTKLYDKSSLAKNVELIKIQGSYFGEFEISENFMEVKFTGAIKPENEFKGSALKCTCKPKWGLYIWYPSEVSEIIERRFIHKHSAIEIILNSGKSYFLNFFDKEIRDSIITKLKSWGISKHFSKSSPSYLESVTNDWKKSKISNFEYLMIINKIASRSYNDLSQYPIFPWVLCDYIGKTLNFEDQKKNIKKTSKAHWVSD